MLPYDTIAIIISYTKNVYNIITNIPEYKYIVNKYCSLFTIHITNRQIKDYELELFNGVYEINIQYCNKITDKGLKYLKGVKIINLAFCKKITDKGLEYLKGVQWINVHNCAQITDKVLEYLKRSHIIRTP